MVKNLTQQIILGTPFLSIIEPFTKTSKGIICDIRGQEIVFNFITKPQTSEIDIIKKALIIKENQINFIRSDLNIMSIKEQINARQHQINSLSDIIKKEICSDLPSAFWERKQHIITLPYESGFKEQNIPTKARPAQMNMELIEYCKKEIISLLEKKLIRKSYSPWSCTAFYVNKNAEIERGTPRLVINYKPLNKVLKWIRYPLPNKKDLLSRLHSASIFSKFDLKSGYWQIQIAESDKYKTAFTVPFGHYEWNVMPFGLKNAPSEFQNIMNDIFTPYSSFSIVYIDDILIFSQTLDQHFKHLNIFIHLIKKAGLVVSAKKMSIFQTKIRFLGQEIEQGRIIPIERAIQFAENFPDELKEKTQLQRFLGSLNYIADYYKNLSIDSLPLYERLRKNPPPWSEIHTKAVRLIKSKVKELPCLALVSPNSFKIVETDASDIGYGGILKQKFPNSEKEILSRYTSGKWNDAQKNYSTIKKEILAIVNCISKFQDDLLNQEFLLRIDCKAAKDILEKDVKNLASRQIFARWQSILSIFDFKIEFIKGETNSLPDYLTREFIYGSK